MKSIIVSPWSRGADNAKNYPYWNKLIFALAVRGYNLIQVGVGDERKLQGCEYKFNMLLADLEKLTLDVGAFISVDNFFHHMAYQLGVKGVVIWGPSDSVIFGYPTQVNILKSREYLRKDQIGYYKDYKWEHKEVGWYEPEEVIEQIGTGFEGSKEGGLITDESVGLPVREG